MFLRLIRKDEGIALAVASFEIALNILKCGQNVYYDIKFLLTFSTMYTPKHNMNKTSDRTEVLRQYKLLVCDKCTMSHKGLSRGQHNPSEHKNRNCFVSEMVFLLGGDFRHTSTLIQRL